jgi:small conductance mechanosensitive channel
MAGFVKGIMSRLQEIFEPQALEAQLAQWLASIVVALIVFLSFYLAWWVVHFVLRPALKRSRVDETTASFIETLVKYGFLVTGLVTALDSAGIKTSAVPASLGIAGLTIGFAARDSLSNIISGLFIFLDRPFVIGDLVEIEGTYGRVERLTLRSTRIVTSDGKMLAVPNTEVINKTVASYTNYPHLRLDISVAVAVTESLEKTRQILLDLVGNNPDYLENPPPRVVVTGLNDYNVAVQLQVWLKDEREHVEKRFELCEMAFNALNEAGVVMPFETFQLTPVEVKLTGSAGTGPVE